MEQAWPNCKTPASRCLDNGRCRLSSDDTAGSFLCPRPCFGSASVQSACKVYPETGTEPWYEHSLPRYNSGITAALMMQKLRSRK